MIKSDPRWNDFQLVDLGCCFGPFVGFDVTNDNIDAPVPQAVALHQHGVGFAHACGRSEIDLQFPASLPLDKMEEVFGTVSVMSLWLLVHEVL
jgi:hypothetical protein